MAELRHAVGLRNLAAGRAAGAKRKAAKVALPSFKQYRESDGQFYFKLVDAQGRLLLQSRGFATPQEAGQAIALLQRAAWRRLNGSPISSNRPTMRQSHDATEALGDAGAMQRNGD